MQHSIRRSLHPSWDYDILYRGAIVNRYNGSRAEAEQIARELDGGPWTDNEASEVAYVIRASAAVSPLP